MRFRHELRYAAGIDEVRAMLLSTEYWMRVAEVAGAKPNSVSVDETPEGARLSIDQEQPIAGVPSFAKKFVGDTARATRLQIWSGETSTIVIDAPGKPTKMSGTARLTSDADETVLTYDLEVKASVPVVGGKLEKVVADLTAKAFDEEQSVGAAWLRGEHS